MPIAEGAKGTRVKACTECRQQKLRCDASENYSKPCSRCRRFGLECIVTKNFKRVKKRTRSELQAELDALKQQVDPVTQNVTAGGPMQHLTPVSLSSNPGGTASSMDGSSNFNNAQHLEMLTMASVPPPQPQKNMNLVSSGSISSSRTPVPATTLSRTLGDFTLDAQEIDDCFQIYMKNNNPLLPLIESTLTPNECWNLSPFLFWTIVSIGARRYTQDPTLIVSLAPEVNNLAASAVFSFDTNLFIIVACLMIMTWPMPFDSLFKDVVPVLSGAVIQKAMNMGLHVYGVGQDFSRTKLPADRTQRDFRAKLWAFTIATYQRCSLSRGTPPICIPDTYEHEAYQNDVSLALAPSMKFRKHLTRLVSEQTIEIENEALSKLAPERNLVLGPLIDKAFAQLTQLENNCNTLLDKFFLFASELQILSLQLFLPQSEHDTTKLQALYELSCTVIEMATQLDQTQNYAECAGFATSTYLILAAFLVLRIGRCHIRDTLDQQRGRRAYFAVIQFHKKMSVRPEDVQARTTMILTQLYTSKKIFRRSDGTENSLLLRCRSRLGMSVVYDCFWWWRQEFAGQPNPYEDVDDRGTRAGTPQAVPRTPGAESGSYTGIGWSPELMFPDFQWPMTDDLMIEDWSNMQLGLDPQLQGFDTFSTGLQNPV